MGAVAVELALVLWEVGRDGWFVVGLGEAVGGGGTAVWEGWRCGREMLIDVL